MDPEREVVEGWKLIDDHYKLNHHVEGKTFSAPPFDGLKVDIEALFALPK